jgi:hypothetical protein
MKIYIAFTYRIDRCIGGCYRYERSRKAAQEWIAGQILVRHNSFRLFDSVEAVREAHASNTALPVLQISMGNFLKYAKRVGL